MVTNYLVCRATFESNTFPLCIRGYGSEEFKNACYQEVSAHGTPIWGIAAENVEQAISRVAELGHISSEEAEAALSSYAHSCELLEEELRLEGYFNSSETIWDDEAWTLPEIETDEFWPWDVSSEETSSPHFINLDGSDDSHELEELDEVQDFLIENGRYQPPIVRLIERHEESSEDGERWDLF